MDSPLTKNLYRVLPREPKPIVISESDIHFPIGDYFGGCLAWGLIILAVGLALAIAYVLTSALPLLHTNLEMWPREFSIAHVFLFGTSFVAACAILYPIYRPINRALRRRKRKELQDEALEKAITESNREATTLTVRLDRMFKESLGDATQLEHAQKSARSFITLARHEYDDNVPGPFWDAIESCAYALARYNSVSQKACQNATTYYSLLKDRHHTFPGFPISFETLDRLNGVIEELKVVVRKGQTAEPNPHFYDVWERRREHRLDREVMIAELATLRDAVSNLEPILKESVTALRATISSGVAQLADEQMKTRE